MSTASKRVPASTPIDGEDGSDTKSSGGSKRRLSEETEPSRKPKKPRMDDIDENDEELTDEQKKQQAKEEKRKKQEAWLNKTTLSEKPRVTAKQNKNLDKPIDFFEFDTTKSSISKWWEPKGRAGGWLFAHTYQGMKQFCFKMVGTISKDPSPTMHEGVAIRLDIEDPVENRKIREIDAHFESIILASKDKDAKVGPAMKALNVKYRPLLENGQAKDVALRDADRAELPPDTVFFPDVFKINVQYDKKKDKQVQISRCYDLNKKTMQAVSLRKGNRVLVDCSMPFGTLWKLQGPGADKKLRFVGFTPRLTELYLLDDTVSDASSARETASIDDDELEQAYAKYGKKKFLPESSLKPENDEKPKLDLQKSPISSQKVEPIATYVAAAQTTGMDVKEMIAPAVEADSATLSAPVLEEGKSGATTESTQPKPLSKRAQMLAAAKKEKEKEKEKAKDA
jgi:hypothetical protein